jgi:hypothetical protein
LVDPFQEYKAGAEVIVNSPQGPEFVVERMEISAGDLILEVGFDTDCDEDLREALVTKSKNKMLVGQIDQVVDTVLLWWRDGDGDLVDELVDALTYLSETGPIWLLTPKVGLDDHVEPSDIQDAAPTAGLTQTVTFLVAQDWTATKLVARKSGRK